MGSVNFSKSRRRSRIVELCIRRWYRRQSPGGAQLSPSVSGDAEECRMGLRRSRRDGPYDIVNNLPTAGLVLAMRQRQRIPDKKSEAPLSVRNPEVSSLVSQL